MPRTAEEEKSQIFLLISIADPRNFLHYAVLEISDPICHLMDLDPKILRRTKK